MTYWSRPGTNLAIENADVPNQPMVFEGPQIADSRVSLIASFSKLLESGLNFFGRR
jgi:hypothetical protein